MRNGEIQLQDYQQILARLIEAWNKSDARAVASFYTDPLDYRDPTVPDGIFSKSDLIAYLELIFKVWPQQEWVPGELFPHDKPGSFSGCYRFKFANDRTEIAGTGIDRIEFTGDKVSLNHVYLNASKWKGWLKQELQSASGNRSNTGR